MMEHTDENKHVLKLSEEKQHEHLLDEIKEVSRLLACNRQWFELESNQDMIEACIYEDRHFRRVTVICWMSQNSRNRCFLSKRIFNIREEDKMCGFYWHFNRVGYFAALVLVQVIAKSKPVRKTVISICVGLCALLAVNLSGYFTGVRFLLIHSVSEFQQ